MRQHVGLVLPQLHHMRVIARSPLLLVWSPVVKETRRARSAATCKAALAGSIMQAPCGFLSWIESKKLIKASIPSGKPVKDV